MKRIANYLICLLLSASAVILMGTRCASAGGLLVEGLKAEYSGKEHIEFTLVNPTNDTVFVAVAVERLDGRAWREVTYSISKRDPVKGTLLTELLPRGRARRSWDSVALPIEAGAYRLRLDTHDPGRRDPVDVDHSTVFEVRSERAQ